jgi:hypothetical protein
MTSQGTAHGRFARAIQMRNLLAAEAVMREPGAVSLAMRSTTSSCLPR